MANMRRILALVMALCLIAGQLAVPAAATGNEEPQQNLEVTVDVNAVLPQTPGAQSQAPEASDHMNVSTSTNDATDHDVDAGIIEEKTSTTTDWSGSQGDTVTSGSETTTNVTGIDDYNGQTLYEGGTTAGTETNVTTTQTIVNSTTEEGYVTDEILVDAKTESTTTSEKSHTGEESTTVTEGTWSNTEDGFTQGQFKADAAQEWENSDTFILGEDPIPEGGIEIELKPDGKNPNTYTGSAGGEIIPLEEGMEIPEGATLVKDKDGNVIGYTFSKTTEIITDSTTDEGDAQEDAANSTTDTTGSNAQVTPDLDAAAKNLGIRIDDNTRIDEEKDADGNITAYVITNTKVEENTLDFEEAARPETGAVVQPDGTKVTTTVEDTVDEDGNVTGFTYTQIHTDANDKELSRSVVTQTVIKNGLPKGADPVSTYTLPAKPADSVTTENGITTTVTVTEIQDDQGNVIGYKETTVKTDEFGAELFRGEENIYGTEETITETVTSENPGEEDSYIVKRTVVETTRVTAEETTFQDVAAYTRLNQIINEMTVDQMEEVVMIDGKLYYIYTGSVTVSEGENHGDTSLMNPITPMSSLFNKSSSLDLDAGGDLHASNANAPAEGFKYLGHGIDSALAVNKQSGSTSANQFRLKSADGKIYFALCIDYDTSIKAGHLYDIEDIKDADYLNRDTADKIRSIALNGYWGTSSGIGSMADVQELLINYLVNTKKMSKTEAKRIADSLTPGQALAATQAALWKYGDSGTNNPIQETNLIYDRNNNHEDEINAEYLYNALIAAANSNTQTANNEGVEFLDAEDITATSIVVKDKIASAQDPDNAAGKNIYNTDLKFTLGIQPTKLIGDLKVTVYDSEGKAIKTVVLASTDSMIPVGMKPDANGVYTISDIEIAEGVTVNLKLDGTQNLGTGVYIYTSLTGDFNESQTLVTLAGGKRTVDLDIAMKLDVQEPTVTREISGETQYGTRTDTQVQTKTDVVTRKATTTTAETDNTVTYDTDGYKNFTTDVTLTKVSTKQTKVEKAWTFSWLKTYAPDGVPHDGDGGGDGGTEILDEEVPLADAPKTGDISALWAVISLVSLSGALMLIRKREEA